MGATLQSTGAATPSASPQERGASAPLAVVITLLTLLAYALLVSGRLQAWVLASDQLACVDPHALTDTALFLVGMGPGLAFGRQAAAAAGSAATLLLPQTDAARRDGYLRGIAALFVVLGMGMNVLWIVPSLNLFVDLHATLLVEVDVLVYLMGAMAGAAWYVLLARQAWIGLLVDAAMALMVVASVLSRHGWCA